MSDQAILTFFLRPITGCLVKQLVNESREGLLKRFFIGAFYSLNENVYSRVLFMFLKCERKFSYSFKRNIFWFV